MLLIFFDEVPWFIFPVNFSFPPGIWGHQSGQETCNEECPQCHELHLRRHLHCRNAAENIWHGLCRLFYELMELPWLLHCGGMFFFSPGNTERSNVLFLILHMALAWLLISFTCRIRLFQSRQVVQWFTVFRLDPTLDVWQCTWLLLFPTYNTAHSDRICAKNAVSLDLTGRNYVGFCLQPITNCLACPQFLHEVFGTITRKTFVIC